MQSRGKKCNMDTSKLESNGTAVGGDLIGGLGGAALISDGICWRFFDLIKRMQ